jgi:hypothetical protein
MIQCAEQATLCLPPLLPASPALKLEPGVEVALALEGYMEDVRPHR